MQQPVIATFYDHILDIAKQEGCSVQEALSEAKKLGVTALEVSCMNTRGRARELSRELLDAGMGITTMPAFFSFESDPDVEQKAEEFFADAKTIGADTLLVIPGFLPEGADPEECTRVMIERTKRLSELAAKAGLALTMEDLRALPSPQARVCCALWTLCRGLRPVLTRATSTSPGRTPSRLLTGFGAA